MIANTYDTEYTVQHLRELLNGVPDGAKVMICYEGCIGFAHKEESDGYDEEDDTFALGTS